MRDKEKIGNFKHWFKLTYTREKKILENMAKMPKMIENWRKVCSFIFFLNLGLPFGKKKSKERI